MSHMPHAELEHAAEQMLARHLLALPEALFDVEAELYPHKYVSLSHTHTHSLSHAHTHTHALIHIHILSFAVPEAR